MTDTKNSVKKMVVTSASTGVGVGELGGNGLVGVVTPQSLRNAGRLTLHSVTAQRLRNGGRAQPTTDKIPPVGTLEYGGDTVDGSEFTFIDASRDGTPVQVNAEEGAELEDLRDNLIVNSDLADVKSDRPSVLGKSELSLDDIKKSRKMFGPAGVMLAGNRVKLGSLMQLGNGKKGGRGMYYRTKLHYGGALQTNSVAGKFAAQFLGTNQQFGVNNVSSGGEWSSFNAVFEEFFVHSMKMQFIPNNQYLGAYVNGTSTNLQTSLLALGAYQHDQGAASDSGATYYQTMNAMQSRIVSTGKPWTFTWRNIEKFQKDGTVGDATTAAHTQAWLNMLDSAKYGGYIHGFMSFATNAAASSTTYLVNALFGELIVTWDVSFRYRD